MPNNARFETPLTRRLAIRHPVLLAPMGAISGGRLAAAVTRAGGLGFVGPGYHDQEWIDRELDAAEGERVGIGFITWHLARDPRRLTRALARRPVAVMLSFGDAAPFVDEIRNSGALLFVQVQSLRAAREALELGADVLVAQGTEAGGHGATRALFPLLPAVVDAAGPVPVVAAGGISDGRGLAAALILGAAGALLGTRFYAAAESLAHPQARARLIAAGGDDTLRTRVFDVVRDLDWPAPFTGRAVQNDFTRTWHGREAELSTASAEGRRHAEANSAGDYDTAVLWAGEGADFVTQIEPAAQIMASIVANAADALARVAAPGGVQPRLKSDV
jgi:nitronate monooxygenase